MDTFKISNPVFLNMPKIVESTDIVIKQEEYEKLSKLRFSSQRVIQYVHESNEISEAKKNEKIDIYEMYLLELSDKYGFELRRIDGSYMAFDGLRIVYVSD